MTVASTALTTEILKQHPLPQLAVFDMDGTLLDSSKSLQPGSVRALSALREAGTRIMLASGRPLPGLRRLARTLPLGEDLILAALNGSVIAEQSNSADPSTEPIATHLLDKSLASALLQRGLEHQALIMLPAGEELVTNNAAAPEAIHEAAGNDLILREATEITTAGVRTTKVLFCGEKSQLQVLQEQLLEEFGSQIELAFSSEIYMEATAAGVDKSAALRWCCQHLNIDPARTIAFGDNGNDVTMLRAAGLGVAMGNAVPAARDAADLQTTTNNDEGIARVFAHWLDLDY